MSEPISILKASPERARPDESEEPPRDPPTPPEAPVAAPRSLKKRQLLRGIAREPLQLETRGKRRWNREKVLYNTTSSPVYALDSMIVFGSIKAAQIIPRIFARYPLCVQ